MPFDPAQYGPEVTHILSLESAGARLAPLSCTEPVSAEAGTLLRKYSAADLFPKSRRPAEALVGLWLYFSYFEEAHQLADSSKTKEGELWHAIVHRQEPDSGNAAYWFRRVGPHPIYSELGREAVKIIKVLPDAEFRVGKWDAFSFIAFCDRARDQPNTVQDRAAREIQRAEWQILFDYCAGPA
jgi:hypothetical protein